MTDPVNTGDLDALEELIESPGWVLVRERVATWLAAMRYQLEQDVPEAKTATLRGSIQALNTVIYLPQSMCDELKGELKS